MKLGRLDYEFAVNSGKVQEFLAFLSQDFSKCVAEFGAFPTRMQYREKGKVSVSWLEFHFGGYSNARDWFLDPEKQHTFSGFPPVEIDELVGKDTIKEGPELEDWWEKSFSGKTKKRYIISAACGGGIVNQRHLDSISTYRKARNSDFVVLPMRGVAKEDILLDPKIQGAADFIGGEIEFNNNLKAMDFRLHPGQVIGTTGLKRFGQKDFSLIIAHTKQEMAAIPVAVGSFPHLIYTTGCITKQFYNSNRAGRIAEQDEIYGGLIIEVESKSVFHIREFQFDSEGGFADLGVYYGPDGTSELESVIIAGDVHVTDTDPLAEKATKEQIAELQPKITMLHDIFSGNTINHHIENSISKQAAIRESQGTLQQELDKVVTWLQTIAKQFPKTEFNVVASNHNEWLTQWIEKGLYVKSPENHRLGLSLAHHVLDKKDPIEEYYKTSFAQGEPNLSNVRFLKRTDSVKYGGFELALHGDKSHSGKFGSALSLEESFGKCVVGHHHSPKVFRGVRIVGTMTKLNLDYTAGYGSSWLHTNCVLYENGTTQMLTAINGKWRASF